MSGGGIGSKRYLLIAALIGAVISYSANWWFDDSSSVHHREVAITEDTVNALQGALAAKEQELKRLHLLAVHQDTVTINTPAALCKQVTASQTPQRRGPKVDGALVIKDMETVSDNDHRSYSEKLNDLLSGTPSSDKVAVASKVIFDLAHNQIGLPDYTLQAVYNNQSDPDLRRVIAQVLSQRGNNVLLDTQVSELQGRLKNQQPVERQAALNQLAKLRSARAAEVILPSLHDPDIDVRLDALSALRDTGNQQYVSMVEMMTNDPDPSISSLAADVTNSLKNLSANARTTPTSAEIEANLPPLLD